jgi:DNA-binding LytR/AlgR family response regulator
MGMKMFSKNLSVAIVEDEEIHANQLTYILKSWAQNNEYTIKIDWFDDDNSFLQAFSQRGSFDAAFLDIYLQDGNGMDIAQKIRKYDSFIPIVFITKTSEYIGRGYDVWAIQYLLKPVSYSDVAQCMDRIAQLKRQNEEQSYTFKSDGIVRVVSCRDIFYFESQKHYIEIHTTDGDFRFRENINRLQKELPEQFIRCSRSAIINLYHLYQYDAKTKHKAIILSNGTKIPVSDSYSKAVKERCFELFL